MRLDLTLHKHQAIRNGITLGWFSTIGAAIFKIWYADPLPNETQSNATHIRIGPAIIADFSAFGRIMAEEKKKRRAEFL